MIPFQEVALLHEIGDELLAEDHHVVRFDLEGHAALADLPIDEELTAFIFQGVLLLHEVLRERAHLCHQDPCELIELGIYNHFNNLELIQLIWQLKYKRILLLVDFEHQ